MTTINDWLRFHYEGTQVLITGHTGFKGAWLSQWLRTLGADIHGLALAPDTSPALGTLLKLDGGQSNHTIDVRDRGSVVALIRDLRPDYVFHLAAQPIVRRGYEDPAETFETNTIGTLNVLEGLRVLQDDIGNDKRQCTGLFVTTDKCYQNNEWVYGYRETDSLGGKDPYSASKAAAELVIDSYRKSFFSPMLGAGFSVHFASARAGNVIGGGDWAHDRIVPDIARAISAGLPVRLRNPLATRPWQHVLEPLWGYLLLAARLREAQIHGDTDGIKTLATPFNFGPDLSSNQTVESLVTEVLRNWPGTFEVDVPSGSVDEPPKPEANLLNLSSDKAYHLLGWRPRWDFSECVARTATWYRSFDEGIDAVRLLDRDIVDYGSTPTQQGDAPVSR